MDISIIIINYNTFTLTCDCIRSIFDKTKDIEFEIILVDNASTECSANLFKEQFPQINLIQSPTNVGFAKGNNIGIAQSAGDYIVLLNSDTTLYNNAIELAFDYISRDETVGVLSGKCIYPDLRPQSVAGRFPTLIRELRELFRLNKFLSRKSRKNYYLGDEWDYSLPVEADWVWGAFFMFRKSDLVYFPEGKLHDTFFMYGEDVQWCYHFKKVLKKKIIFHPSPMVIHYIGGSDKSNLDSFEKYKMTMLPHEYLWLEMVKGAIYARLYYFLKAMLYFSLFKKSEINKAKLYINIASIGIK